MNTNLSIIISTFNSSKTLQKTLESLLLQTYKNYEVIIVDGLSKDNTVAIIKEYEKKFADINVHYNWTSEKDSGIYDAWNKALGRVNTSWIAFLGSDDTYYPNALEIYNQSICINPAINFISSKIEVIDINNKIIRIMGKPYNYKQMKRYMDIAHVGSFHHIDLFKNHGNFNLNYRVVADYDFFLRCGNDIKSAFINKITAKMLNTGVSNQKVSSVFKEVLKVHLSHKKNSTIHSYYEYLYNFIRMYVGLFIRVIRLKS